MFVLWRIAGLPCFMVSLLVVCPARRPRPRLWTSLLSVLGFRPRLWNNEGPQVFIVLSWLSDTAFHLAVYASCRPLGRLCKTRLRCGATRFPAGFGPAWEALRRFSSLPQFSSSWSFLMSFCLFHLFSWFLVSVFGGVPRRHALHGAIQITKGVVEI